MNGFLINGCLNEGFVWKKRKRKGKKINLTRYLHAGGKQPLEFKEIPLQFCSYYCEGYKQSWQKQGFIIEVDKPVIYACPADNFELMRDGIFLPGFEKFLFKSIDEMLEKYSTSLEFRKDFQRYFSNLDYDKIAQQSCIGGDGERQIKYIKLHLENDYTQYKGWLDEYEGYNEITFQKPLEARLIDTFMSREELHEKMNKLGI